MKKRLLPLIGAGTLFALCSASAAVYHFETFLSGANEDPPVPSSGTGYALVTYDDTARTLSIHLEFDGLTEGTTVAHIHAPTAVPFAGTVGVATFPGTFPMFPAGVTSGTYDGSWTLADSSSYTGNFFNNFGGGTVEGAELALFQALATGRAYVNIHTTFSTSGEIRGFLRAVPDGGSMAILLGCAMIPLLALGRSRR